MRDTVFTIGHSTHTIEKFIELLKVASIEVVTDVRSRPYSRMNPQFNRETIKEALSFVGIKYVFLGMELGARSDDSNCYRDGQVQYDLLSETELFKQGIERVKDGTRTFRIALMCAEKEPLECHRTILVARKLIEQGLKVKHILADGRIETQEDAIERLITKLRVPESDMFRTHDIAINEAYMRQSKVIAFREEPPPEQPSVDKRADKLYGARR